MMKRLNANDFSELTWYVLCLTMMWCTVPFGKVELQTALIVTFVTGLNVYKIFGGAKIRNRLDEAKELLKKANKLVAKNEGMIVTKWILKYNIWKSHE